MERLRLSLKRLKMPGKVGLKQLRFPLTFSVDHACCRQAVAVKRSPGYCINIPDMRCLALSETAFQPHLQIKIEDKLEDNTSLKAVCVCVKWMFRYLGYLRVRESYMPIWNNSWGGFKRWWSTQHYIHYHTSWPNIHLDTVPATFLFVNSNIQT